MKHIVIPPPRGIVLRLVDRLAEGTLVASIAALAVLALRAQIGG